MLYYPMLYAKISLDQTRLRPDRTGLDYTISMVSKSQETVTGPGLEESTIQARGSKDSTLNSRQDELKKRRRRSWQH